MRIRFGIVLPAMLATMLAIPSAYALQFLTENNPPLNLMDGDRVGGIATEVLREAAKRAQLNVTFQMVPWTEAYSRAQADKDTCVYSTARTPARAALFQWIGPIARGSWSAFALEGFSGRVVNFGDLANYRIGVVRDARADYLRGRGLTRIFEADRDVDLPAKLTLEADKPGGVDLWITQAATARSVAKAAGIAGVTEVFPAIMSQDYWLACGLSVSPETVKSLAQALSSMRRDGSYRELTTPRVEAKPAAGK